MNKKLLFGLFAAVGLLFTTTLASCSQEEPVADSSVRFSLKAPAANAAIGDAKGVDLLVWAVYDKDGNKLDALCGNKTNAFQATPLTESVPFQLAKGQTYTVVFWAQNSACTAYDYSDLKNIHYTDVTTLVANDETRDAFFGNQTFTVTGDITETVELKRPFAQLNFATTQTELDALTTTITGSTVKVSEIGTGFNALTGEITSSATDVEFAAATAFTEDITLTLDGTTDTYKHLSMNYILANDATPTGASSVTADVTFTFTTTTSPIEITSPSTPLQRNWRTNIIGSLTNTGMFNITITPDFDGETTNGTVYGVKSATGKLYKTLAEAINAGETDIQLAAGDYTLDQSNLNKDLKITGTSADTKVTLAGGDLRWKTVTLENMTIISPAKGDMPQGGVIAVDGKTVLNKCVIENVYFCLGPNNVFNDCTFNIDDSNVYNVWTYGANVDFNNCTFNCAGKSALVYAHGGDGTWRTVNFTDCEFYASTPVEKKAAIEIDSSLCLFNVNITRCTATGFANGSVSGNPLYNLKNGTEGVNCNITVVD